MNQHLLLHIDSMSGPVSFKPFLEESSIIFDIETIQSPIVPVFMNNSNTHTRTLQKARFSFNVFPDSRDECILNYKNLKKVLAAIKPVYGADRTQLIPHKSLFNGFISIKFSGLFPGKEKINLKLNSFSYDINQDLGYIQVPYSEILTSGGPRSFSAKSYNGDRGNKMIPIGYNIKLEGNILQPFSETAILN